MNKTEQHKKAIIEALEKSLGVVTTACLKVGVGRTQFYHWLKEDKKFAGKVDDIQNIAIDFAESQLYKQIGKGNTVATIFYLKTKGKHRGYIERIQTEHISDREPVEVRIVMPKNEDKGNDKLSED